MTVQFNPKTGSRGIEWPDETRNVIGGCKHGCMWVMPDGTVIECYACDNAEHGIAKPHYPHGFAHHYWRPEQLKKLPQGKEPLLIFADSMSDLFAPNVPEDQIRQILAVMQTAPQHTYLCLTKAAPQLLKYIGDIPPNLWVGISSPPDGMMGRWLSDRQKTAMLRRGLEVLAEIRLRTGNLVWLSAEPLSQDWTHFITDRHPLDWAVIGAASAGKKYYQPNPNHVKNLLEVFDKTNTPVFFKGNIAPLFEENDLGNDRLNRWREDYPTKYRDGTVIPAVARRQKRCDEFGWTKIALPLVCCE